MCLQAGSFSTFGPFLCVLLTLYKPNITDWCLVPVQEQRSVGSPLDGVAGV